MITLRNGRSDDAAELGPLFTASRQLLAAIALVAFVVWCAKETLPLVRALL